MVITSYSLEIEGSRKEHHREHVRGSEGLPSIQKGTHKVPQEFLEVQIAVLIKLPHLCGNLHQPNNTSRTGPKDKFGAIGNYSGFPSESVFVHFLDLGLNAVDGHVLVQVYWPTKHSILKAKEISTLQVLALE